MGGAARPPTLPSDDAAERRRLAHATLAHMRHELRTPINAIIGYSELLIEDAGDRVLGAFVSDLERILAAGRQLLGQVNQVLDPEALARQEDPDPQAFRARLRHALRTPLSAVMGYCELLLEEAEGREDDVGRDLERIRTAGARLLALMSDIEDLAGASEQALERDPCAVSPSEAPRVEDVLRSIPPVARDAVLRTEAGRVLVVDDNPTNRDLLGRRMARDGHVVHEAVDGVEALAVLADQEVDIVLLDIVMPRMHGYEVLRRMKQDPRLARIPVVMLSSLDDLDSVVRCIQLGADDFLSKPYEPVILRARVGACLEKKRMRDRERQHLAQIRAERETSERLLLNILPAAIAERLKQGERTIADSLAEATVLFADIVGFTELSAAIGPEALVGLLNDVFSAFDRVAAAHGLEKIKTIGDAYMAAAGLPTPIADHATAGAAAALAMLAAVPALGTRLGQPLAVRIGLHSGPVVAGVIGENKFSYDLWGDTVNTAARMESHGLPGAIQVSAATRALIEGAFTLERRGVIPVKGKGPMETWLLTGRRDQNGEM